MRFEILQCQDVIIHGDLVAKEVFSNNSYTQNTNEYSNWPCRKIKKKCFMNIVRISESVLFGIILSKTFSKNIFPNVSQKPQMLK